MATLRTIYNEVLTYDELKARVDGARDSSGDAKVLVRGCTVTKIPIPLGLEIAEHGLTAIAVDLRITKSRLVNCKFIGEVM